jgi:hypothetical protein
LADGVAGALVVSELLLLLQAASSKPTSIATSNLLSVLTASS